MKQDKKTKKLPLGELFRIPRKYIAWIYFAVLILLEIILVVNNVSNALVILSVEAAFTIENAVKIWGTKKKDGVGRIICYVFDFICLMVLTYFSDGTIISTLLIVVLSEFYLNFTFTSNIVMFVFSAVMFVVIGAVSSWLKDSVFALEKVLTNAANDLLVISFHFLAVNLFVQIFRKNREIDQVNKELNSANEKLQEANRHLQEAAVLEERQRIAKEIHDTAGHSLTTVIMQTEAAKLIIDSDPEEAKRKITAANLQAKRTLEELRDSVHLLSGFSAQNTLRDSLLAIVQASTDGTGIVIRSEIEDISLSEAKSRFLLNTLKEGISNGLRHGEATAFWFSLTKEGDRVKFLLSDNGKGMPLSELSEGFGLSAMRRHAEELGGTIGFETEPGEGFEIHLTLCAEEKDKAEEVLP